MVGGQGVTAVRLITTGLITALAGIMTYYPHQAWIPVVIGVAGALGIHVIPSVTQEGTTIMSTGPELMGIAKPAEPAVPVTEPAVRDASGATVMEPASDPVTPMPGAPEVLRAAAADLVKLAEAFEAHQSKSVQETFPLAE